MSGTKAGGLKARDTILTCYPEFYKTIGRKGGQNSHNGGFACLKKGPDGLTGQERAKIAGAKGRAINRRGPAKAKQEVYA